MAEVLEAVCQKRGISNPKDYALVLDLKNQKLFIPLDRTVKSLQGNRDLMLIRKSMLQNYGVDMGKRNTARSTDPNGTSNRSGPRRQDPDCVFQHLSSNVPQKYLNRPTALYLIILQPTRCASQLILRQQPVHQAL